MFARIIASQTEGNDNGITKFSQVWPLLWRFLIPFGLVAVQPDMGTALVYMLPYSSVSCLWPKPASRCLGYWPQLREVRLL